MIKRFLFLLTGVFSLQSSAQLTLDGSKFTDNWSLGISGGVLTPLYRSAFFGSMRPDVGLELTKMLHPTFGLSLEGKTAFNTTLGKTTADALHLNLMGRINLSNLFAAYTGRPRRGELEVLLGAGYIRNFIGHRGDRENWNTKAALNMALNTGDNRALQLFLRPAILFLMDPEGRTKGLERKYATFELTAGIAYRFKNSNDTHHFTIAKLHDNSVTDRLNAKINDLRQTEEENRHTIASLRQQIETLQKETNSFRELSGVQMNEDKNPDRYSLETFILFTQGKADISDSQLPYLEHIAMHMKKNTGYNLDICGYASPEGDARLNKRIAQQRAEAVGHILTERYGIAPERIHIQGMGADRIFDTDEWNRICVCILTERR